MQAIPGRTWSHREERRARRGALCQEGAARQVTGSLALSHVSPLAQALNGKSAGESVTVAGHDLEIAASLDGMVPGPMK